MSGLPYHLIMGMPALSPTMEAGTLASWNVKVGDSFIAGDSLAKIDTDKASMDFEAQDDGVVAKLLVPDGSEDVAVNSPILVVVENVDDVAAFENWVPPTEPMKAVSTAAAAPIAVADTPVIAAVPITTPVVVVPTTGAAVAPTTGAAAPVVATAPAVALPVDAAPTMGPAWGATARVTSPIAKTLAANQQAYISMYGTTGQLPL